METIIQITVQIQLPAKEQWCASTNEPAEKPAKLEKVRVSLWDRSNSPNGQKLDRHHHC